MAESERKSRKPLTVNITYSGLGIAALGVAIWYYSLKWLHLVATFDRDCLGGLSQRGAWIEDIVCGTVAGPSGWIYLIWFNLPFILLLIWLRLALRQAKEAREDKRDNETDEVT